jgi:divalent metal cation (Fe/Co/Zn/Cd) transporter
MQEKGKRPFWTALHASKDPATYTVLAEDAAAIAGLAIAAAGVFASHYFSMPVLDGAASVLIGVLLAGVAVLLIRESRGLLIGEGVRPETSANIRELALHTPGICRAAMPLSMYIGPSEALLTLDVEFEPQLQAHEVASIIANLEQQIRSRYPTITKIYIEAGSLSARGKTAIEINARNT